MRRLTTWIVRAPKFLISLAVSGYRFLVRAAKRSWLGLGWCWRNKRYIVGSLLILWMVSYGGLLWLDRQELQTESAMRSLLNQDLAGQAALVFERYQKTLVYQAQEKLKRIDPEILTFAGEANFKSGHFAQARHFYSLAENKMAQPIRKAGIAYNLASVMFPLAHDSGLSIPELEKAIDLNNNYTYAKSKLQELLQYREKNSKQAGQNGDNNNSRQSDPYLNQRGNGGSITAPPDIQK